MMKKGKLIIAVLLVFVAVSACIKDVAQKPTNIICGTIAAKYSANIKPIIDIKCASSGCHGGSAPGNFTTFEGLKSYCDNGVVNDRVFVKKNMPIGSYVLTPAEQDALKCWLENGAQND